MDFIIFDEEGVIDSFTDEDEARQRFATMSYGEDGGWRTGDLRLARVLDVRH